MKAVVPPELEKGRITTGLLRSTKYDGFNGAFRVKHRGKYYTLIVSDGGGWEHVSVEVDEAKRVPSWDEMCWVKYLVWEDSETVIQIHPAKNNYVNVHPYVLHLWKPVDQVVPQPPKIFV